MTTRTLRLRANAWSVGSQPGAVAWAQPEAVLLQDGICATLALSSGTDAAPLTVRFSHLGEAIYPTWRIAGIEVQVRTAVIGETAIGLSQPVMGVRVKPVDHSLYDSGQRVAPVPYAAQANTSVILGGPVDLWSIFDQSQLAIDAVTAGVSVELDPQPWTARAASLDVDNVELYLHLESATPGDVPLFGRLSRVQQERLGLPGQEPIQLQPGQLAVNLADKQIWSGDQSGTPVPMIKYRGRWSQDTRYYKHDSAVFQGTLYEAQRDILPGSPFETEAWVAL